MSFFDTITALPEDPIFGLQMAFTKDPRPNKVNLGIGAYKDADGKSYVFNSVRKAEEFLLKQDLNKDYLPIDGLLSYISETAKLIFGNHSKLSEGSIFGAQTVGGTSALRIGGEFLANNSSKTIYIPNMTWANHRLVLNSAGLKVDQYPYYNTTTHQLDFSAMCERIKQMQRGEIIVLQGTSHNPTGINPSLDQWKELSSIIKKAEVFPFFDLAYQGFGKGLTEDVEPLLCFVNDGHSLLVAYTYAKNMGLYGERVGALFAVTDKKETAQKVATHIKQIIRSMYSNPPLHGARIVEQVLKNEALKAEWIQELSTIKQRIDEMRKAFVTEVLSKETNSHYQFLNQNQTGLFIYTGLNETQTNSLKQDFGIYLPDGRLNVAGINSMNMDYVIESILSL